MDWFMFVLVISGLLNQPEPGALRRLFLVHVLQLLVQQAGLDTWLVRQGCAITSGVFSYCTMWDLAAFCYFLVDILIMLFILL